MVKISRCAISYLLTVLKYVTPEDANFSAISFVVTTADTGWPLPMGFPMVTMSGHTPEVRTGMQRRIMAWHHQILGAPTTVLKGPEIVAHASKTRLNFVSNDHTSSITDIPVFKA